MKYSIVIPTYNHCDDLLKPCVESIFKYSNINDIELIISANGCNDNTNEYVESLKEKFSGLGLENNLKVAWDDKPLGYAKATNAGIELATTDLVILLNNDTVLLPQETNTWLTVLEQPFNNNSKCGISCIIKGPSEPAGRDFAVFFCVMIHRKVFDTIGLLSLEYGVGGGEDTDFCIQAENAGFEVCEAIKKEWSKEVGLYVGDFPIYHKGEGTVHDPKLVPNWSDIFLTNSLLLGKKYNPRWYQWRLSNHSERAVFFKGDHVFPREVTRYKFAADNLLGNTVFELGCSSGYGVQFFPKHIKYTGLDYDKYVIQAAKEQDWGYDAEFVYADINNYELKEYDTIIAFETIEHIKNGLEVVEKLKNHCKRLIITVPRNEKPGEFSSHHLIHNLDESSFKNFKFKYIDSSGNLTDSPKTYSNVGEHDLLLAIWDKTEADIISPMSVDLSWMKEQDELIYREVIETNQYDFKPEEIKGRTVIDAGANIGCLSLLAAKMGAELVIGLEPIQKTFDIFKSNIERSNFKNIIPLKNVITATDGGYYKVSKDNENSGANSLYNVSNEFDLVEGMSLDTIIKLSKGDDIILKLDCEGAEYDVIMNATKESLSRVKTIVMEVHSDLHPVYKGREVIENKLKELGFVNTKLVPIYYFTYDNNGNVVSSKELPYSNQRWERGVEKKAAPVIQNTDKKNILCSISTKGRYDTTLALAMMSVANQTLKPNKLIVYDDNTQPKDVREIQHYWYIFNILLEKGIDWEWVFAEKRGQHHNHQRANIAGYKWVWRLDDDTVAEANTLETLYSHVADDVGAVGGSILTPPFVHGISATGKIENIDSESNIQWDYIKEKKEVDHLHCSFLYRAGIVDYCLGLSTVAHREETLFTYELKLKGYKNYVVPNAITWHLKNRQGGIREGQYPLFEHDNNIFKSRIKHKDKTIVVLDCGMGDHIVFKKTILPKLKDPVIFSCYPEIVPGKSIAEAHQMLGSIDQYNVYRKMDEWNWKGTLEDAFKKFYNIDQTITPIQKHVKDLMWLEKSHKKIFNEVIVDNEYKLDEKYIAGKNVIDIGANVGMFSIFAAYLKAKKVISIEPFKETYEVLVDNVKTSGFDNIETINKAVLTDSGKTVMLNVHSDSGHNSLYEQSVNHVLVETTTLADLVKLTDEGDIVLKIDCEGSEYDILLNASEADFEKVVSVHMEVHMEMHPKYKGFDIIKDKLNSYGFELLHEKQMQMFYFHNDGTLNLDMPPTPVPVKLCYFEKSKKIK